jgi:hypothetical protein
MANNGLISTSDLDFDTYRANLVNYLKNQEIFKDYNFDGSNISVLLDLLSYNTTLNAFYLNMVGSEMFLDTSQLRESAVSHAKELNYTPRSRASAVATVNITANPGDASPLIVIPKYFRFTSTINGVPYIFTTDEAITVSAANNYNVSNVNLYEGRVTSEYFLKTDPNTRYIVSSANVDSTSIGVSVYDSPSSSSPTVFAKATTLYGLSANSAAFFVQGYGNDQYEITFGNGVTGRTTNINNLVKVTYRDTNGADGNRGYTFTAVDRLTNNSGTNFQPTAILNSATNPSAGGSERETTDSIKFNAPRFYATQDRAVTKQDYISLIKASFPTVQAVAVYGGEEVTPPDYGSVYISVKPYNTTITPTVLKNSILSYLSTRTVLSITPKVIDPDYFYIKVDTSVFYNPSVTPFTINEITGLVRDSISSFSALNLSSFNANFRFSKLLASIDASDASVVGNETSTRMIKRIAPTVGVATTFNIKFNNQINTDTLTPSIYSDNFTYTVDNTDYTAYLKDDGTGNIDVINFENDNTIEQNVGTINYTTGQLDLTQIVITNYTDYISIYANILNNDIILQTNQILNIEQSDVTVSVSTVTV